jgi:hypothetical protein
VATADGDAVSGVLVRLQMVVPQDSLYSDAIQDEGRTVVDSSATLLQLFRVDSANRRQLISLAAYARTDGAGKFSFAGLQEGRAYEVIPLQPGYQFGTPGACRHLTKTSHFLLSRRLIASSFFLQKILIACGKKKRWSFVCPMKYQPGTGLSWLFFSVHFCYCTFFFQSGFHNPISLCCRF